MAESFLGSGDVYMDRLTAAGVRTGLFFAGNADKFAYQPSGELKKQISKGRSTYGQVMTTAALPGESKLQLAFDQLDKRNMAINLLGEVEEIDQAAGSVAAESLTVLALGNYQRLAQRNLTDETLVVTRAAGSGASAWTSEGAHDAGDFVVSVAGNNHFYKCTVAGTSGVAEPTWPTDGSTVSDGTVTWQDMGLIVAVEDTDYEITIRSGMFRALSTGSLEAGEVLSLAYDYGAVTGWAVTGGTESVIKAYLFLDGKNETNGKDVEVEVWEVQFLPQSLIDFLSSDFLTMELEGTPVTPDGYSGPIRVRQFD